MKYEVDTENNAEKRASLVSPGNGMSGCLVLVVLLLSAAIVAMSATMYVFTSARLNEVTLPPLQEDGHTCQSDECIISAARIITSLDPSADPCHDFYQFACGGWIENNPIPDGSSQKNQFQVLNDDLTYKIKHTLETPDTTLTLKPLKQARSMYKTCMDEETMEKMGVEPMLKVLRAIGLTDLPLDHEKRLNETDDSELAHWQSVIANSERMLGYSILFSLHVGEHPMNTSKFVIQINQGNLGFPEKVSSKESEEEAKVIEVYIAHYIDLLVKRVPGAKVNTSRVAHEVLQFSKQLRNLTVENENKKDLLSQLEEITFADLQNITDSNLNLSISDPNRLNWTEYVNFVFDGLNVTLDFDSELIIVKNTEYFQKLSELLQNTPAETIERYIWWRVFSALAPHTMKEFREARKKFWQATTGIIEDLPKWKVCAYKVNEIFGMAIGYEYIKKHFNEEAKQKALEMVNDIHKAFEDMVKEVDWMDEATKNITIQKINAVMPFIGFPDWMLIPGAMEKYYEGIEVVDGEWFASHMKIVEVYHNTTLKKLNTKPDRNIFVAFPTTVNAFYSPQMNSITFPAGILHPPFYGLGLESLNYGAIGAIIGHEFTHGFDNDGRQFDLDGNLKEWWTNKTLTEYKSRVQCIVDQYSNYYFEPLGKNYTVNGKITQGENIADNGGLREALRAYEILKTRQAQQHWGRKSAPDPEPYLPGFANFSHKQLFFLGYANVSLNDEITIVVIAHGLITLASTLLALLLITHFTKAALIINHQKR
ncbi:Hypothetical predicted protein [Cloeon dipterum]|uniref:Peptidase M13 N-terminal domain-containing protein n=1 Tax=Cloeon dipterum TaxID=197152 RepID=A0A8S1E2B8_9INSE|nr:Hypothetical predicted protein [Cloeon dipterum]